MHAVVEGVLSAQDNPDEAQPGIDVTISICGSAGDGANSAGQILNRAVALMGYHIMNFDSYPAEIRGFGKSMAHTRVSDQRVLTPGAGTDCLVSLNDPHTITELGKLNPGGVILYDSKPPDYVEEDQAVAGWIEPGMVGYGVPLRELSNEAVQSARARNIVGLGVIAGLFRMPKEQFREAIRQRFASKAARVVEGNLRAFDLGCDYAETQLEKADPIDFGGRTLPRSREVEILSGNEAAARGCIEAGLRLYAGYPITPATKIMEILAKELPQHGGVVVQTEDEIAAIGHAIGGGFSGRRAATATSGPGLCLMVEALNLAVMAEIPLVIIHSQRAGPSTGLPTKTEQSDLNLAVLGASGDSPRPVMAPADVAECRLLCKVAFEVAESLQTPVIVLLDLFLSNRFEDVAWEAVQDSSFGVHEPVNAAPGPEPYQRYAITDDGVSPRSIPGQDGLFFTASGLEHNEASMPNYSPANHQRMTAKRFRKLATLLERWPAPETVGPDGKLDVGIISWGSSIGAAKEALGQLQVQGVQAGGLFPRLLWPLNERALRSFSERSKTLLVAEMNAAGQFASLVEAAIGRRVRRVSEICAGPLPVAAIVRAAQGGDR